MIIKAAQETRGIRNNNPGNLRHGPKWQGLAKDQLDASFATFETPAWGIRALAVTLSTYFDKYGLDTVADIISRWAPESENNTRAYVAAVCQGMGVRYNERLDLHEYVHMMPLVEAIILHENGKQPYSRATIDEGLKRAGIIRKRNAAAEPVNLSAATAAGGTVALAAGAYSELKSVSTELRTHGTETGNGQLIVAGSVVSLVGLLALAVVLASKWRAKR